MQNYLPQDTGNLSSSGQPVTEQVNPPIHDHAGSIAVSGSAPRNVTFPVDGNNRGLMRKLCQAFFDYLRNRVQ